ITSLFSLKLDDVEIANALNRLVREKIVERVAGGFALCAAEQQRLEAVASDSVAIAETAMVEWLTTLADRFPGISEDEELCLREDLETYLRVVIQRHGAEAALLLYPDEADARR